MHKFSNAVGTHFNNAVAAYLNYLTEVRHGNDYQAEAYYSIAKNFADKHKAEHKLHGPAMFDVIQAAVEIRWPNGMAA